LQLAVLNKTFFEILIKLLRQHCRRWLHRLDLKGKDLKDAIYANFEALGLDGALFTAGKSGKVPYGRIKKYFRENDGLVNGGDSPANMDTISTGGNKPERLQFYYHPDHLGSSSYITDISGEVYQHNLCR